MLIYNIEGNTSDLVEIKDIHVGNTYALTGLVERGEYKGNLNTYFKEYVYRNTEAYFMTKSDGRRPFAIATNDCERDGFPAFHLSKILVEKGHHIIYAYHTKEDEIYSPIKFVIFEVTDINPIENDRTNTIYAKVVTYGENGNPFPAKFNEVIEHAVDVFGSDLCEQLIPKYCFNPNRVVTLQLFQRNEHGEVESFLKDGTRLILNNNSLERKDSEGKIIDGGLFRVFYSKKFVGSKHIYVDGKKLESLNRWDVDKYKSQSYLVDTFASAIIQELQLTSGMNILAVSNKHGDIRPIYKSSNGSYQSFQLSPYEGGFIEKVELIGWD